MKWKRFQILIKILGNSFKYDMRISLNSDIILTILISILTILISILTILTSFDK